MLFLGIDGGGTRSTAVVANERGDIIAGATGESINYYAIGMQRAREHLQAMMSLLREDLGPVLFDMAFVGVSALEMEASSEQLAALTQGIVHARELLMHSDTYIALVALTLGEPGIIVISGTGSMAAAIDREGGLSTVGGWGHILGDQGSAYDIALRGIRSAIAGYDQLEEETMLTGCLVRFFGVDHIKQLIDKFYDPLIERHVIAGFAVEVSACAERGDMTAQRIIEQSVAELVQHAKVLADRLNIPDIVIGGWGGVFQNNPRIFETFKLQLNRQYPDATIKMPDYPPEIGAIMCCFRHCRIQLNDAILHRLKASILKA